MQHNQPLDLDTIHTHFGLSYANYLVLPRTLLQSMDDAWQIKFVTLLDQLAEAFQHVPQAEAYKVEAATEHIVSEMGFDLLEEAGIEEHWYDEPVPEDLSPFDLAEWKAEHEKGEPTYYDRDGNEVDPHSRVLLPATDPVPHYSRGRTRIAPAAAEAAEVAHVVADDSPDPEHVDDCPGCIRPCGHDDYHDPHQWHDWPSVWCPGISYADDDAPATRPAAGEAR